MTDIAVLTVSGDVDALTATALRQEINRVCDEMRPLVFDLSAVQFINSAGLGVIVYAYKRCRANGRALVLAGLSESAGAVFRITRMDTILTLVDDVDEARARITGGDDGGI